MATYAITGSRDALGARVERLVASTLARFPDATSVATGGCYGADTIAITHLPVVLPNAKRPLFLPKGKKYNEGTLDFATEVFYIEGGYLKRDDALAEYGVDGLIAFPLTATEVRRSGTWATIRRARNLGRDIYIFPLNEA